MTSRIRPRRSVLYMPGSNVRAQEKAKNLPVDGVILDLEDATAPDRKAEARDIIRETLARRGEFGGRELIVRVNGLDTPWGYEDLVAMADAGADAILLPKVDSADAVRRAVAVLEAHGAPDSLAIWCMLETARGVLHAEEIAGAHPRVACFVMGTSDLARELNCAHTPLRLPMLTSLGLCLLAARAAGLAILDGVYLDLEDSEGFEASCVQGRELGFDGKTLIHPKQIEAANRAFAPSEDDVARARKIIEAWNAAKAEGKGVVVVDGRLVENLHVVMAERTLALHEAIVAMHGQGG
jgi:citrate lyase subunit beta/citryl-CoA lyase